MNEGLSKKEDLKSNNFTFSANDKMVKRCWYIADAQGKTLGRFATKIASVLKGKNKTYYTSHIDNGDYVIVINANKVHLTGSKYKQKIYYRHSGYPGGLTQKTVNEMMEKFPNKVVEKAIFGMLPHNKLGRQIRKKLFVYSDNSFKKHNSQKPKFLEV
ncbi:50S ribosomal protein L13 [Candidatus Phytoplasma melaleucae]|uniref:50S ribosomal protein L13 n=1 Tax=Candidatus Phytoplasma melaleucae TaxID=2982630 RepID=UPI0031DBE0FA